MIDRMIKQKNNYILQKYARADGFTLVELLVAMAVFSVAIIAATDIFLTGFGGLSRIFGAQAVQESGRFIAEAVSREVRMSSINSLGGVALASLPAGASGPYYSMNITNSAGQSVDYAFDAAAKQVSRAGALLIPNDIEAIGGFYLTKSDSFQPRVTLTLGLINKSNIVRERTTINLQTTVSPKTYTP